MQELWVFGVIAICVFAVLFYQSYRDKQRWRRIASGMSLFGNREDIPPLVVDGTTFEPHERHVIVIWGDMQKSGFYTVSEAREKLEKERSARKKRAENARIYAWDGESWKQRV